MLILPVAFTDLSSPQFCCTRCRSKLSTPTIRRVGKEINKDGAWVFQRGLINTVLQVTDYSEHACVQNTKQNFRSALFSVVTSLCVCVCECVGAQSQTAKNYFPSFSKALCQLFLWCQAVPCFLTHTLVFSITFRQLCCKSVCKGTRTQLRTMICPLHKQR